MSCPEPNRLGEESEEVLAHLAACASCRDRRERLGRLLAFPAEVEPPPHVLPAVMESVAERLAASASSEEDAPPTISQQRAEEILRRITTRGPGEEAPPPRPITLTPRRRSRAPVVAAAAVLVAGALAVALREAATPAGTREEQLLERKFRSMVVESEALAFGYASFEDFVKKQGGVK